MAQRILHIIDSLQYRGAARQLLLLAEGLAKEGWDAHVAALDRGGPVVDELHSAGIPTTPLGRRFTFDPLAFLRLKRHVVHLRPHVIHTWNAAAAAYARATLCGRGGTSGEASATTRLVVGQYRIERWKTDWAWAIDRRVARRADRLVTNTPVVRDWCLANGLPREKFLMIPSGVSAAPASDLKRDELLRELKLPADARLIGVVGALVPDQRVKDLIWAADLLRVLHDNLRVLVIGDGPLRGQLERYARLASDLDHIQFLGQRGDLWRIMPHLDALWNGSAGRSISVAILEAMAAGVPVVASDTPVNRELVVDGETGYLVPLGSRAGRAARARHTDHIFSDRQLAARLAAASHQRIAEHFSAGPMIQRHEAIYRRPGEERRC